MSKPWKYGQYHWTVLVVKDGEVSMNACETQVTPAGDLLMLGCQYESADDGPPVHGPHVINAAFAKGTWKWIHASSVFDGSAVAADYWKGQAEGRT